VVIVDDAAEYFLFMYRSFGGWLPTGKGRMLVDALMGASWVVIQIGVFHYDSAQMCSIKPTHSITPIGKVVHILAEMEKTGFLRLKSWYKVFVPYGHLTLFYITIPGG
jgi:hypothetical protein